MDSPQRQDTTTLKVKVAVPPGAMFGIVIPLFGLAPEALTLFTNTEEGTSTVPFGIVSLKITFCAVSSPVFGTTIV